MESFDHRSLVSALAEDLAWLEDHCRAEPNLAAEVGKIRLSAGLVRNVIGPFLNGQPATPLHVAVVGGAGTGKSTVVNVLLGRVVAEANPQAGFTRHPTAYVPSETPGQSERSILNWSAHLGFLGNLHRLSEPGPSNIDEDVYQVRRVTSLPLSGKTDEETPSPSPLAECVVWDCPDMTTWAATGYVPRLIETAALADVILYVASDERYNDAVPTEFLYLLLGAGKRVVVCLTKMREKEAPEILAHFRSEVLGRGPKSPDGRDPVLPCFAIPSLTVAQLSEPATKATRWRIPLVNQVGVFCEPPRRARHWTVLNAVGYLDAATENLLAVARQDLEALEGWRAAVFSGQADFNRRYRNEYLGGARFQRFDEAGVELLDLLELPSVGKPLGLTLWVLRSPYRFVRGLLGQMAARPESVNLPEKTVLEQAFDAWLDQLRSESLRKADSHPVWKHVAVGFHQGLADLARDRFHIDSRRYELSATDEADASRRDVTERLRKNPAVLNTMRVGKLLLDGLAIGSSVWVVGLTVWLLLAIPLAVSLTHQIVEWVCRGYVEQKREQARLRQETLMAQHLSAPLGEWLGQWPVTGGSTFERLQRALRRVPESIRRLGEAARQRVAADSQ